MREDLDRLPAMPRIADKIDGVERFCYLDSVGHMARDGVQELDQFAWLGGSDSPEKKAYWKSVNEAAAAGSVDWDSILRLGNSDFDRDRRFHPKIYSRQNVKQCTRSLIFEFTRIWLRRKTF